MLSMCYLKDGRLVSSGDHKIVIYNLNTYQPDIIIDKGSVNSVCGLKNGNLAYGGGEPFKISIREINSNDTKLIQRLSGHKHNIKKIIEVEEGK